MGHLFVAHGDLTKLACDAVLIPCDAQGWVTPGWQSLLPTGLPRDETTGWFRLRDAPGVDGTVALPDVHGRTEILALHARRSPVAPDADLGSIAHQTPGFSGADLANVINEASLLAVRAGKSLIEQEELEEAIDRVLLGPQRKSHVLSRDELWRISVHESGHAIVARAIQMDVALQKLSIVARGRGRGGATIYSSSDQSMMTQLDLTKSLVTTMGGAAAELYVFGQLSTGVENDIEQATKMAHAMASVYGMSPAIGPVAVGEKPGEVFIGRDLANMGNVAAATLELVDSETRRLVHEAEQTAKRTLELNADVLEDLANALLHSETLSGPALDVYLAAVKRWPEPLLEGVDDYEAPVTSRRAVEATQVDGGIGDGTTRLHRPSREEPLIGGAPDDDVDWDR